MLTWLGKVVAALVCVVALVACDGDSDGGDDSDDPTTSAAPVLTKKQYVRRVNEACIRADSRFVGFDPPAEGDVDDALRLTRRLFIPTFREQLRAMWRIRPPARFARKVDPVIKDFASITDQLEETPLVTLNGGRIDRISARFRRLGLTYCGIPEDDQP